MRQVNIQDHFGDIGTLSLQLNVTICRFYMYIRNKLNIIKILLATTYFFFFFSLEKKNL